MTPGVQEITVSREGKTVVFPIVVLAPGASLHEFVVSKLPDKTKYRPYEPANWDGLEVMEVSYGGNPAN
jgi:hypothetical protein